MTLPNILNRYDVTIRNEAIAATENFAQSIAIIQETGQTTLNNYLYLLKNTNTATNLQLVIIPISENIGTPIPLGNSFTGNAHKAKMVTSPDGRFLALSYSKGTPLGWFNATSGGNEIRTYQLDTDYTTATDLGAQAIPAVADIHSMSFNADCSYMYYTASSETEGHKLYSACKKTQ